MGESYKTSGHVTSKNRFRRFKGSTFSNFQAPRTVVQLIPNRSNQCFFFFISCLVYPLAVLYYLTTGTCWIAERAPILATSNLHCANSFFTIPPVQQGHKFLVIYPSHPSPSTNTRSKHTHLATVLRNLLFLGMVNTAVRYWLSSAKAFACAM